MQPKCTHTLIFSEKQALQRQERTLRFAVVILSRVRFEQEFDLFFFDVVNLQSLKGEVASER